MTRRIILTALIFSILTITGFLIYRKSQSFPPSPEKISDKAEGCYSQLKDSNKNQVLPNPAGTFCLCMGGTVDNDSCQIENKTYSFWEYFDLMNPYDNTFTPAAVGYEKWQKFCNSNPDSVYCEEKPGATPKNPYSCPDTEWIDCLPVADYEGIRWQCTEEYLSWAKTNCPNFKGATY